MLPDNDRFIDYANRYRPEWLCIDLWKKSPPDLGSISRSGKLNIPGIGWVLFESTKELSLLLDCSIDQARRFITRGKTDEGYEIHAFNIKEEKHFEKNLNNFDDISIDYL